MIRDIVYSDAEMKLFKHFGFDCIAKNIQPTLLYPMLASKAFSSNDQTCWADSLRRCLKALEDGIIYRATPEWDLLIETTDEGA